MALHYAIIGLAAFFASGLTLFSGFGLGTLLLPVMALFFPIDLAIALTAVVHALNNLFKCWLLGRHADRAVVLKFGLPAILSAMLGPGCSCICPTSSRCFITSFGAGKLTSCR